MRYVGFVLCSAGFCATPQGAPLCSAPASSAVEIGETWEPVRATFLRPDVRLYWVYGPEVLDDQARRWIWDLGAEREGQATIIGYPVEAWRHLIVTHGGRWRPVNWPGDLRGLVDVTTGAKALEFLRLFSSPDTSYTFRHLGHFEIRRHEGGRSRWRMFRGPGLGEMLARDFDRLDLRAPEVVEFAGGFRIRRTVGRLVSAGITIGIIDETVGSDGEYVLRVLWEAEDPIDLSLVNIQLPI